MTDPSKLGNKLNTSLPLDRLLGEVTKVVRSLDTEGLTSNLDVPDEPFSDSESEDSSDLEEETIKTTKKNHRKIYERWRRKKASRQMENTERQLRSRWRHHFPN